MTVMVAPRGVFQFHGGILVTAGLGDTARNAGEHARNGDGFAVAHVRVFADDVVHRVGGGIRERTFQATQRVVRNVQPSMSRSKFSFSRRSQSGHVRDGHGQFVTQSIVHAEGTEEVKLARRLLTLDRHGCVRCRLVNEGQRTAGCGPGRRKAPALMSDSMVRLLHTCSGTFFRKSLKDS